MLPVVRRECIVLCINLLLSRLRLLVSGHMNTDLGPSEIFQTVKEGKKSRQLVGLYRVLVEIWPLIYT